MRKLMIIMFCLLPVMAGAQVSSSLGMYATIGEQKVMTETVAVGERYTGYAYTEMSSLRSWYGQFFWEQKYWDAPWYIHAEYRGTMAGEWYENTAYLGAAWCYYNNVGYLAVEPLFMWKQEQGIGAQLSIVGEWSWKYIQLQHYTDIWRTHKMQSMVDIYAEVRAYYKMCPRVYLGVIGTNYWSAGFHPSMNAYLALKLNF